MIFLPIEIDDTLNEPFSSIPECNEILQVYSEFYPKVGFSKPWIGYFASLENAEIVGVGGFKGKPKDGKIEIAYGTFKKYEGCGIGKRICNELVQIAKRNDPSVLITARTLPEFNASTSILRHNGFEFSGPVWDEEDGDVWEWKCVI